MSDFGDLPVDDLLGPIPDTVTDADQAYDGGWEQALEEGDGFEDHLLGEKLSAEL